MHVKLSFMFHTFGVVFMLGSSCHLPICILECSTMALASSYAWEIIVRLWHDVRMDLRAAGVPREAFPQRLPKIYEAYTVRINGPAHVVRIQVLLRRRAFLVPYPLGRGHSLIINWGDNVAEAWEQARRVAGLYL